MSKNIFVEILRYLGFPNGFYIEYGAYDNLIEYMESKNYETLEYLFNFNKIEDLH
jgi:hypothetical protein